MGDSRTLCALYLKVDPRTMFFLFRIVDDSERSSMSIYRRLRTTIVGQSLKLTFWVFYKYASIVRFVLLKYSLRQCGTRSGLRAN